MLTKIIVKEILYIKQRKKERKNQKYQYKILVKNISKIPKKRQVKYENQFYSYQYS